MAPPYPNVHGVNPQGNQDFDEIFRNEALKHYETDPQNQKMSLVTIGIILVQNVFPSELSAVIYVYKKKIPSKVSYETLI